VSRKIVCFLLSECPLYRNDSCSRNVYRHDDLKEKVVLEKVKDHFIFNIESTGAIQPTDLVSIHSSFLWRYLFLFISI